MADLSLNFATQALGTPSYGDITLHNGDLLLTADTAQGADVGTNPVAQAVAQSVRTMLSEYFLDTSLGVPYYQELLGQRDISSSFETALQNAILSVPGVTALVAWGLEKQPTVRRLILAFTAQTTTGQVIWSGSINPMAGGGT